MRRNAAKPVIVVSVALAVLLLTGTAWAEKPEKDTYLFTGMADYTFSNCADLNPDFLFGEPYQCDNGLLFCELGDIHLDTKLFFDKDGNPRRYTEKTTGTGAFFELGNPDNNLEYEPFHYTFTADLGADSEFFTEDDVFSYRGLVYKIKVPGHGIIFRDVGNVIVDSNFEVIFQAGQHDFYDGDFDAVCDYLTNN